MRAYPSKWVVVVGAAMFWSVASVATARAATVVVTSCSGDADLRAKVAQLQAGNGGTVIFACGPNPPPIVLTGGVLALTKKTVIDAGAALVTISGGNATQLFTIAAGAKVTLRGLTLTKGFNGASDGGAIVNQGKLTLERCLVTENQATVGSGGAILSLGKLTIRNSELSFNKAANGGALYPRFAAARTTIVSTVLKENETTSTTDGWGGAILLWDGASLDVRGSAFLNNGARTGGAVYVRGSGSTLRSRATRWRSNLANADRGGAIYNEGIVVVDGEDVFETNSGFLGGAIANDNSINVNGAWFDRNDAALLGGAIHTTGMATLRKSAVTDGLLGGVGEGAGIYNTGMLQLENVTLSGNVATRGGAIANAESASARAELTHVTLYDNEATQFGAAIAHSFGVVTLRSSIVAGSTGSSCGETTGAAGTITSMGFSAAGDSSCGLNAVTDIGVPGLVLGALAQNGGGTPSHLPPGGSDVIDAAPAGDAIFDQRHVLRPKGAGSEIGAVEVCPAGKPGTFELVAPAPGEKVLPGTLFEWNDASCATSYTLTVREGSSTGPLARVIKKIGPSSWVLTEFLGAAGPYAWKVSACNKQRCLDSPWQAFKYRFR